MAASSPQSRQRRFCEAVIVWLPGLVNVIVWLARFTVNVRVIGTAGAHVASPAWVACTLHEPAATRVIVAPLVPPAVQTAGVVVVNVTGSVEVGKLADFVELSADPWAVDRDRLIDEVQVAGTWLGGRRIDLDEFLSAVAAASHPGLPPRTHQGCC